MNEQGWGLKDALIFIVIVCVCIFISMFIYSKTFSDLFSSSSVNIYNEETYDQMENELEKTAHTYTDNYYYKVLKDGDEGIITIRDMQGEDLISDVKDIKSNNKCSGYVYFKNINGSTTYKAYINCGENYITDGYKQKYDEPVK